MRNVFGDPIHRLPKKKPAEYIAGLPLDIEAAKTHFAGYKRRIEDLHKEVVAFEIKTDEDAAELTTKAGEAKKLADQLDTERKEKIKEPDSFVRSLNSFVKGFRDILTQPKAKTGIVEIAKAKIGLYQYEKELERRKQEEAARKARADLQKKMDEEAAAAGVQAPELPPVVLPEAKEAIRTGSGSAHMQTEWKHHLIDIEKVPSKYLVVDDRKVKLAIKAGIRQIPGLEIKEVPKIQLRKV